MTDYNKIFSSERDWKQIPPMEIPEEAELPLDKPFKEIQTFDLLEMGDQVGNVYKMVVVLGERADALNNEYNNSLKWELEEHLDRDQVISTSDYEERPKQEKLVKKYEQLPKPTLKAIYEYLKGELFYKEDAFDNF